MSVGHTHPRCVQLDEDKHLNTSFKHFMYFSRQFSLIATPELEPMRWLIDKLLAPPPQPSLQPPPAVSSATEPDPDVL